MKNKKWITLATAVVLAVTALPLGVFAAKKDEAKLAKVTLNEVAHSIFYAPQYVAIEEGYFKDEGLDMTLITGFGADKTMTAVISGEADIGFMGAEASIYAYQEGATDPVVNFAQLTQRAGNFLVAREEMPDFKWEDLKGKKVGVSINQTSHYLLMQALETAGLTDADVDLVNMTSSDAGVSFISGDLDAAVTWEPYLSNAVEQGVGKLIFSSKDAPGSIVDVLAVGTDNKDAAWLAQVNEAYEKGLDYLNDDSTHEEAVEIVAKHLEVSADEADSMISTIKLYSPEDSSAELKDEGLVYQAVGKISGFYFDKGIIEKPVEPSQLLAEE